jgi:hypothetical protein
MTAFTREEILNMAIVESGETVLLHCTVNGESGTVILHRKGDNYRPLFVSVTEGMQLEIPALNRGPVRPKGRRSRWTLRTAGLV